MTTTTIKQPKGVYTLFSLQMLGMVGYSMIYALTVLYCTNKLGFNDKHAYAVIAAFNALCFATSVPGGYLAERYLGFRFASILSILLSTIGLLILLMDSKLGIYLGLGAFTVGNGMMLPALYVILGRLYSDGHVKRESGFVLSYIGMNVGAFMAMTFSGNIRDSIGYQGAFFIGAITTALMLPIFLKNLKKFGPKDNDVHSLRINNNTRIIGTLLTLLCVGVTIVLINYSSLTNTLLLIIGAACLLLTGKMAFAETGIVRKKMLVFLSLTIISIIFWTLYSLAPSALTIFIDRNVDRHVLGMTIPTPDFTGLNPFFIVTLGPLVSLLWVKMSNRGINISIPAKFAIGTLLMGIGYLLLDPAISFANALGYTGAVWIVVSYFFQTVGELLVGPVGYAMVGEYVPAKMEGMMMGIWQLATGIAAALSEFFANTTTTISKKPLITNPTYQHSFLMFGLIAIAVAALTFILLPLMREK